MKFIPSIVYTTLGCVVASLCGCTNASNDKLWVEPLAATRKSTRSAETLEVLAIVRPVCKAAGLRESKPVSNKQSWPNENQVALFEGETTMGPLGLQRCFVGLTVAEDLTHGGVLVGCNDATNNGTEMTRRIRARIRQGLEAKFGRKAVQNKADYYFDPR